MTDGAVDGVDRRRRGDPVRPRDRRRCRRRTCRHCCRKRLRRCSRPIPSATSASSISCSRCGSSLMPYYSINICDPTPVTTWSRPRTSSAPSTLRRAAPDPHAALLRRHRAGARRAGRLVYRRFTDFLAESPRRRSSRGRRRLDACSARASSSRCTALGAGRRIAPVWPVAGLGLASNAQIYPSLLSGESVSLFAQARRGRGRRAARARCAAAGSRRCQRGRSVSATRCCSQASSSRRTGSRRWSLRWPRRPAARPGRGRGRGRRAAGGSPAGRACRARPARAAAP